MDGFLLLSIFNILTILGMFILRKISIVNPLFMYFIFNWIMVFGCFNFLDFNRQDDYAHGFILTLTPVALLTGYFFAIGNLNINNLFTAFWSKLPIEISQKKNKKILILYIITIFLSLIYYQIVGYNLMFQTLTSTVDDFVTMRLGAYSGDKYFAPGIFNQFKNTIFPILFIYYLHIIQDKKIKYFYGVIVGFILIYCVAGTGQRTFLITSGIIIFYILLALNRGKISPKTLGLVGTVIFFLFSFLSVNLKRTENDSFFSGIEGLLYRIMDSNQYSAITGFRYIYSQNIQYGYEWYLSFIGLIPGVKGSDLSNRVFEILFGGTRGTAPLNVWGSAYHNFGFAGSMFLGIAIGFFYTKTYIRFLRGNFTIIRVCIYAGLFAYLSSWIAGAPTQLINNGLLGCVLLLMIQKNKYK